MTLFSTFVRYQLPYFTLTVLILGFIFRIQRWLSGKKGEEIGLKSYKAIKYVVKDWFLNLILFKKVFKRRKMMWLLILIFHFSAAAVLFGHLRGFGIWSADWFLFLGEKNVEFMVEILPIYMGGILAFATFVLLFRRIISNDVRSISWPDDYFAIIILILAIFTGMMTRLTVAVHQPLKIEFIPGILILSIEKTPIDIWMDLHFLFTQIFFMYIPFSKLIHIISGILTSAFYSLNISHLEGSKIEFEKRKHS